MSGAHALDAWREEKRSAYLYRRISDKESGTPRQVLFLELARAADTQAALWVREARLQGLPPPDDYRPDTRTRLAAALVSMFGPRRVAPVLTAMKVRGMTLYRPPVGHAMPTDVNEVGARHRGLRGGGNLRAAVFGVSDGLVSNASLILGMAGATGGGPAVVLAGLAGLLAGAFSMAAGEYVSVRSQRELYEHQIGMERDELDQYPAEEAAELALIYQAKGVPEAQARALAERIIADPDRALDTLAREELGLNPDDLGSPWGAAGASFTAFGLGAAVPLLPFLFGSGPMALGLTVGLTAVTLFAVGALMSLFSGRSAFKGGARMLLIGMGAGAATYAIGRLVGVGLL